MFRIEDLETPSFLLDLTILEKNILDCQKACDDNKKQLWPMTKTHKSSYIASLQLKAGAKGFLVGTIDEAEILADKGMGNIMLAYPYADSVNLRRIVAISERINLYCALDHVGHIKLYSDFFKKHNQICKIIIIIDSGLGRFGVSPEEAGKFALNVINGESLELAGIATHSGQVYGCSNKEEVNIQGHFGLEKMQVAKTNIKEKGIDLQFSACGTTPAFDLEVRNEFIDIVRPGNYVFHDNIQIILGTATEKDCAFTVQCSIISKHGNHLLINCGSKCLGLDKGAHGVGGLDTYGRVKGHPGLKVVSLSEEVGKIYAVDPEKYDIGDKLEIIPNHSCSSASMTSFLTGHRNGIVESIIEIDMRPNSKKRVQGG
ncbi:MAG TPA: amino-acid racemase [Clostridiales bacterium]|nr:amino-acid racemase [Clostridiales bacterium]